MIDVVLPVLDERDAIAWVLSRFPSGYNPIVVDNGSTDGSGALAQKLGAKVVSETKMGFGSACWAGVQAATNELICFMDCDGSLDPCELPKVCTPVEAGHADLVVGARAAERGAWPVHARIANRYLARELRRRFGWQLTDPGPMRAIRRDSLLRLNMVDRRSGWPLEMLLRAGVAGFEVREVTVSYLRRTGRSKVTGTVRGTAQAIGDIRAQLRTHGVS